jgi:general L-amino acid transport system substrate-binding protein
MRIWLMGLSLLAVVPLLATASVAQNTAGPTLTNVRAKGFVECSVGSTTPGFGFVDSKGLFRGLDVDICRAVAAAIFGEAAGPNGVARARFVPLNGAQRLPALQSGQVDMVVQTLTQTMSRETANGVLFAGIDFYDGQSFLVRKSSGVKRAADLGGATICVSAGSTSELNVADWARASNIQYSPVVFDQVQEGREAYNKGRCDAYSTDASQLAALATITFDPENQLVLPDAISKEPLGPAVRQGDDQWYGIVKWTLNALIEAEEQGITQSNIEEKLASQTPQVKRLLGQTGDYGKFLALDNRWAYWAIKEVGNYGEIYNRHFGPDTAMKLPRGKNALWKDGGLMYSAPIR